MLCSRYFESPFPTDTPIRHCKQNHKSQDRTTPVDILRRDRQCGWEWQKDDDEETVENGEQVNHQIPTSSHTPRTVNDGFVTELPDDNEDDWDDVREVEGEDREGNNGVKCGGGADVDESEEDDDG